MNLFYKIIIMPTADIDIKFLKRNEPLAYKKVIVLVLSTFGHYDDK